MSDLSIHSFWWQVAFVRLFSFSGATVSGMAYAQQWSRSRCNNGNHEAGQEGQGGESWTGAVGLWRVLTV